MTFSYTGLRQATRTAVRTAIAQGLSDEFWQSLDSAMSQINPEQVVVSKYPTQAVSYPIVHVDLTFGRLQWAGLSAAPQNWSPSQGERLLTADATVGVEVYALSAIQRDRLADALETLVTCSDMLDASAFRSALTTDKVCVQPMASTLQNQGDVESNDVPWMWKDHPCFMTGFSFDVKVSFLFDKDQAMALVKHVVTTPTLEATDA